MRGPKGFLLIEVLTATVVLAVAITACLGGISQALKLTARGEALSQSIWQAEPLIFQMETGVRQDLAAYGGNGEWEKGFQYKIKSTTEATGVQHIDVSVQKGQSPLDVSFLLMGEVRP